MDQRRIGPNLTGKTNRLGGSARMAVDQDGFWVGQSGFFLVASAKASRVMGTDKASPVDIKFDTRRGHINV